MLYSILPATYAFSPNAETLHAVIDASSLERRLFDALVVF